jgi:hypothetical protein
MTCQLLSCLYFDGRSRHEKYEQKGLEISCTGKIMTHVKICTVCGQNYGLSQRFLKICSLGGLLLVRLLILLEPLTLTLNCCGYQSTSRHNQEEINLRRKTSSGWSTDCLFRYVGQKPIRGKYTPVIPRERRKG